MLTPQFGEYLRARREEIELALARVLPTPPECPEVIAKAMAYSLAAGGKRLRPVLCLAGAEAVGGDRVCAMPAACALELIHTYSLVHDDLPAMDNDSLRRGRPTLHVVAGDGLAILAGDGLLTEAFALLSRKATHADTSTAARTLRVIGVIAEAAGAAGMVGGQALDLACTTPDPSGRLAPPLDAEGVRQMHALKTGALIRASAVSGAIMGGGNDEQVESIDGAAAEFGLAFQIVDDILDVEGVSADLGKTPGKDAATGKPTYPALYGLSTARQMATECLERAEQLLRAAELEDSWLMEIGRWIVQRSN
jgi:geranylgeranyl diphosphate synthase type II